MVNRRVLAAVWITLIFNSPLLFAQGARAIVIVEAGETTAEQDEWQATDTGLKLGSGFKVNDNAGVEIFWVGYGEATDSINNTIDVKVDARAVTAQFAYSVPIGGNFDLMAKIGFAIWKTKINIQNLPTIEDDGVDAIASLGAEFRFTQNFGVRVDWDYSQFDKTDISMLSAGAIFYFD